MTNKSVEVTNKSVEMTRMSVEMTIKRLKNYFKAVDVVLAEFSAYSDLSSLPFAH